MAQVTLMVKMTTQNGKREELRALWEKYAKRHAAESDNVQFSCYSYDLADANTICLFEVLRDGDLLPALYQSEWFKEYLASIQALLAGPPVICTGSPIWIKELRR